MKEYPALRKCQLFKGIEDDISKILVCLNTKIIEYDKDAFIVLEGGRIEMIGIVLSGKIRALKESINGNVTIINEFAEGEIFGESFVCAGISESMASVQAAEKCEIMFLDYGKVITVCADLCGYHFKLIENMIGLIAKTNIMLNQKMEIIIKRTIRERLLAYFEMQAKAAKSRKFEIPFSRTDLAFFIGVDRSSMTRELRNMQDDGLIHFDKRNFELL